MSRPIKPRWCPRDKAWLVPLGDISEVTGRRKYVVLRDEDGQKIGHNDVKGKIKALRRLEDQSSSGPMVWDLIIDYLHWHEDRGSKPSTISDHQFQLEKFGLFEYQGVRYYDRPALSITLRDLARVRESMEARGCRSGYIRHLYASVLACWRWATRPIEGREPERLLSMNPLEGAERPRAGRGRKVIIPWSMIQELLQFAEKRAWSVNRSLLAAAWRKALMFRLVAESGCRPIEACRLEWSWVDEKNRVIVIPVDQHKTGWRHGDDRIFGLTVEMASHLGALRAIKDHCTGYSQWVFAVRGQGYAPTRQGFDHWFSDLRRAAITAGFLIPPTITLYSFRHSLVTQARQGGISYRDLAVHMGHSEQVAEEVYSHLDPNFVRSQFDRMHAARTQGESS